MTASRRILITGAAGPIGQALRRGLAGRYALRVSDIRPLGRTREDEEIVACDITDFDQVMAAAEGMDAIIHLAGESTEASVERFLALNFQGTWNVYEAARRQGVRRILFASSNHTVGCNPRGARIDRLTPVRPDTRYGVSKTFGEALGSLYADKHGLEVLNMRIGSFQPEPKETRHLATWLSPADMVRLAIAGLEAPGLHCETVFGVSANTRSWWDNRRAFELGYAPQDNAEGWAGRLPEESAGPYGLTVHGGFWADHGMAAEPEVEGRGMPPTDPAPPTRRVLVTGAAGHIGGVLRRGLAGHYELLRLSDIEPLGDARPGEEVVPADLTDPDAVLKAVDGVDAIVHLGGIAGEAGWDEILKVNIAGTWNVFEAARRCGVRRILFASSNHAIGFYPRSRRIDDTVPKRPDTRYGLSKAFGEDLGRMFADKHGFSVMCMRIGSFQPQPKDARMLSTWLSCDDMTRLVRTELDAPGFGFAVVYGVSANSRGWWDNSRGSALGYAPQDDAEAWADALLAADPPERGGRIARALQGGVFAEMEYDSDRLPAGLG